MRSMKVGRLTRSLDKFVQDFGTYTVGSMFELRPLVVVSVMQLTGEGKLRGQLPLLLNAPQLVEPPEFGLLPVVGICTVS